MNATTTILTKDETVKGRRFPLALRPWGLLRGAVVLAAVLAGLLVYGYPALPSVVWAVGLSALSAVRLDLKQQYAVWLSRLFFFAGPLLSLMLVEALNYNNPWTGFSAVQILLNLGLYYLGAAILYFITGRRALSAQLGMLLAWCIGMANHYVIAFRGRTIFPADLLTLRTAANVAGNYDYTPSQIQVTTGLVLVLALLLVSMLPKTRGRARWNWPLAGTALAAGALFLGLMFGTDFLSRAGIEPSMWTTRENGLLLNFSVCLRYSKIPQPDGYSQDALHRIAGDSASAFAPAGEGTQPVNVIAIMNESFSDLSVIPGVESNQDFLPFWNSLTENTVRGYAYASVFGGTTANSEYEFMTGNTTAFLPAGTVPYQMYVSEGDPSLAAQMKALGYRNIAMHPYYSSGWNRIPVYKNFGFDRAYFQQDIKDPDYIRGYISDQSNFENLIDLYEGKTPGEPLFLFNVTMQNHSAYNVPWTNLDKTTWLTGAYGGRFSTVDQYLSLIYQSDRAFEYLIDYFSQVEEPTMILMFGDHQPQVATNFYTEALGGEQQDLDTATAQRKQMVPFLIWANYDIPEQEGLEISLNYLSTLLMETANLPLTGYQQFLGNLEEALPVVNTVGFLDGQGQWTDDVSKLSEPAQSLLEQYQMLLYNNIFDKKNRLDDFFFLSGKE